MRKYELDLTVYQVEVQVRKEDEDAGSVMVMGMADYPLRDNISAWLRAPGVFKSGEEIVEAVTLAKAVRDCEGDSYIMDEREAKVLKGGVNKHLELTADGRSNLGGPIHEEAICRIFGMKESG